MTARQVIDRLTIAERMEIAAICLEALTPDLVAQVIYEGCTEDELAEVGIAIRQRVTHSSAS